MKIALAMAWVILFFCTRKGIVTATPNMYHQSDRISTNKSLEVRHDDGTVMLYLNLNPDEDWVGLGKYVYPGQPIGSALIKDIQLILYESIDESGFKSLPIKFYINENTTELFSLKLDGKNVSFSNDLITAEMNKREIKKYKKRLLY